MHRLDDGAKAHVVTLNAAKGIHLYMQRIFVVRQG